jgi:hypothetical protein
MHITKNKATISSVDEWFIHAPPKGREKHWVSGRSALECAEAWCGGKDGPCVPRELVELLDSHPDTRDAEVQSAIPEHPVRFDKLRGEPRNADLAVLAKKGGDTLAISIEAKADEPFDRSVQEIVADTVDDLAHGGKSKVNTRVQSLAQSLFKPRQGKAPRLGDMKYQLLTATAGALAYAAQTDATCAVLIVHEFVTSRTSPDKQRENARELDAFVVRITVGKVAHLELGKLIGPIEVPGKPLFPNPVPLYIGKARRTLGDGPS